MASIRTLLQRIETTTPSAEVKPMKSLDKMADAITKCTNYRVVCEAELARIDEQRSEMMEKLEEAQMMEKMAKDELRDMVKNVCGVRIEGDADA